MNLDINMPSRRRSLVFACLCFTVIPLHAADLYRWQDDQGNVHYTDRVPPEYVQHGYRVISEQGITIQTIKSVDEVEASAPATPAISAEQAQNDRRLLMTYSNETEIQAARARKLDDLQALIELSEETISLLEMQFRQLAKEAGDYEKQGRAIPESLLTQIAATRRKINKYQDRLEQHNAKLAQTAARFDADLQRFRELKSLVKKAE